MTTPTLREAAQAALDALESLQGGCTDSDDGTVEAITVWCPEVIESLRSALAAQPAPDAGQSDRICRVIAKGGKYTRGLYENPSEDHLLGWEFYGDTVQWFAPIAQQAAPAQARQPLTWKAANDLWVSATIERADMRGVYLRGLRDGEAAHGITVAPKGE